ncbi:MAG TPA: nuclear transport factor 2 family protein [Cyclobacteriaceae bacterium]|nr:nuclear transport factor 2 family protein [Cyclobacteriaceae bacterium]
MILSDIRVALTTILWVILPLFVAGQDVASLNAVEAKRAEYLSARQFDQVIALYDVDFRGVLASGKHVNKTQYGELLHATSPHIKLVIEELSATVNGPIGIVRGRIHTKSKSGTNIAGSRFLIVYVWRNNEWKILESQETIMLEE